MSMATSPLWGGDGEGQDGRLGQPCPDFVAAGVSTRSSRHDLAMLTLPRMTTHHHADHSLVALRGELDVASRDMLSDGLEDAISSCSAGTLVVDLSAVEFMDCTVLGVLVHAHRHATLLGVRMVMISPPIAVRRLLNITRIDRTVPTRAHLRDALSGPATTPQQ